MTVRQAIMHYHIEAITFSSKRAGSLEKNLILRYISVNEVDKSFSITKGIRHMICKENSMDQMALYLRFFNSFPYFYNKPTTLEYP